MNRRQIVCALSLVVFVSLISANCDNGEDIFAAEANDGNGEVNLFPHKPEGTEFWGYRDRDTGIFVMEPRFDDALDFSEGLAAVKVDGRWGYVNKGREDGHY